jgi:alpha-L-fucosidase
MQKTIFIIVVAFSMVLAAIAKGDSMDFKKTPLTADAEPMHTGSFGPSWNSLRKYQVPDWFRDAKFGIWAHWGPQCEPEVGDWYARGMYEEGSWHYKHHVETYGHPSKVGFKDIIHRWKAEKWDPDKLVAFYKQAGARYFFAMANHHDNLDLWDSKHQPWNSVNMGPKKDIIAGWEAAARKQGLRFGVSVHAAHAWSWYEVAQGADKTGPYAGVPYDGKLTKADGKGTWWEGYDPQDLYAQNHTPGANQNVGAIWNWTGDGFTPPSDAYCQNIYDRTIDLIDRSHPDLIYFDDTVLPLYPVSDIGLKIAAHYYNANTEWHDGKNEAVIFGKILNDIQKQSLVWDIERGQSDKIEPLPWQTCTCIGSWHYNIGCFKDHWYKSAQTMIHMLVDVVSKNGNLLLNVPVRADGTIDEAEIKIVQEIGEWMRINGEAIYETRPWKVFGEGPASDTTAPMDGPGFNEGKGKEMGSQDVRFTKKGNVLYAIVMGWPTEPVRIKSLGKYALLDNPIKSVSLLGSDEKIDWTREDDEMVIAPPKHKPCEAAIVFRMECGQ